MPPQSLPSVPNLEYPALLHDVEAVTRRAQEGAKACKAMAALLQQTAALEEAHGAAVAHVRGYKRVCVCMSAGLGSLTGLAWLSLGGHSF